MRFPFSQGGLQGSECGCAPMGAQGCPSEQGPCTPGGCVPGQGTLPPARVSTQPARRHPHGAAGRSCGWKEQPLAGQGPSAAERVLRGSGLLTAISEGTFQFEVPGKGRCLSFEVSHLGWLGGQWDISKGTFQMEDQRRRYCRGQDLS